MPKKKKQRGKLLQIKAIKQYKHKHKHPSWLDAFKKFRLHHRILSYTIGAFGIILVWRGVWDLVDQTPIFNHPLISLISGVGLTFAAGVFFEMV